jgi:hypothetical protein
MPYYMPLCLPTFSLYPLPAYLALSTPHMSHLLSPPSLLPLFFSYLSPPPAALSYLDDKHLKKPEDVLRAVSVLLANELCMEPSVRHAAKVNQSTA